MLHGAWQRRNIINQRQIQKGQPHLQRILHAVGIGVAQERVAHVVNQFDPRDCIEWVAIQDRIESIRTTFQIIVRKPHALRREIQRLHALIGERATQRPGYSGHARIATHKIAEFASCLGLACKESEASHGPRPEAAWNQRERF